MILCHSVREYILKLFCHPSSLFQYYYLEEGNFAVLIESPVQTSDYIYRFPSRSTSLTYLRISGFLHNDNEKHHVHNYIHRHLPIELLDNIFRLAKVGRKDPKKEYMFSTGITDFKGDPNEVNPNEEHPLYKSLRLVCKRWTTTSTLLLFETIVLFSHAKVGFHEVIPSYYWNRAFSASWGHLRFLSASTYLTY